MSDTATVSIYYCGYCEPPIGDETQDITFLPDNELRKCHAVFQPLRCHVRQNISPNITPVATDHGIYYIDGNRLYKQDITKLLEGNNKNTEIESESIQISESGTDIEFFTAYADRVIVLIQDKTSQQKIRILNDDLCTRDIYFEEKIEVKKLSLGKRDSLLLSKENVMWKMNYTDKSVKVTLSQIPLPFASRIDSISCGKEHVLALTEDCIVLAVGGGSRGQLGLGTIDSSTCLKVVEALDPLKIVSISAGGWHSIVLSDSGDLYGWGWNESGQVGTVNLTVDEVVCTNAHDNIPRLVFLPALVDTPIDETFTRIATGSRHSAAVSGVGNLYTWGWNGYGQIFQTNQDNQVTPKQIAFFQQKNLEVVDVHCGHWYTLVKCLQR